MFKNSEICKRCCVIIQWNLSYYTVSWFGRLILFWCHHVLAISWLSFWAHCDTLYRPLFTSSSSTPQGSDCWWWCSWDRAGRASGRVLAHSGRHGGVLRAGVQRLPWGDPLDAGWERRPEPHLHCDGAPQQARSGRQDGRHQRPQGLFSFSSVIRKD